MKTFIALMLLCTFSSKAMAQDNAIRQKIEAAGRNSETAERAAKADVLLFSKKRIGLIHHSKSSHRLVHIPAPKTRKVNSAGMF